MADEELMQEEEAEEPMDAPELMDGTLENINLVESLMATEEGEKWLESFGKRTVDDFKDDRQSCQGYYERAARTLATFLASSETYENGPAKGKRKPALPMLAKLAMRVISRLTSMVLTTEPVPVSTGDEDSERAERVGKHIAWEKRAKHPEWKPGMRKSMAQMVLIGECVRYVGWDFIRNRKLIEYLPLEDCVYPYAETDPTYNLENAERITRVIRMRRSKLEQAGEKGFFYDVEEGLFGDSAQKKPTPVDPTADMGPIRSMLEEIEGRQPKKPKSEDKGNPNYRILERHSWERIPNLETGEDEEGEFRHVAAWVEHSTGKVLRLVIMEAEDPVDRKRYEAEERLNQIRLENLARERAVAMKQMQAIEMAMAQGLPPPMDPSQIRVPEEPQIEDPEPIRMTPVHCFIRYPFFDNPEGSMGLGIGLFATELNYLANDLMGEHIIGHRLAAIGSASGYMSRELKGVKGIEELELGKFKVLPEVDAQDLQTAIKNFPFERPRSDPGAILQYFDSELQAQTASADSLSGVQGPDRETAAAAKIRAANAVTAITNAMEKVLEPLAIEYQAYCRLNATFMSDAEYFMVVTPDPLNPQRPKKARVDISKADYSTDYDITFDSDARMALDPGYGQSAITAYQLIQASPFASPEIKLAAEKKALKALKANDLALMYPDEIPKPPPPSPKSQVDENEGFFNEKDAPVLPDDDDVDHLQKMEEMEGLGLYQQLSSTGRQLFDRHRQAHRGQAYRKGKIIQAQGPVSPTGGNMNSNDPMGQAGPGQQG